MTHRSVSVSGSGEAPRRNILEKIFFISTFTRGSCHLPQPHQRSSQAEASRCETGPLTRVDAWLKAALVSGPSGRAQRRARAVIRSPAHCFSLELSAWPSGEPTVLLAASAKALQLDGFLFDLVRLLVPLVMTWIQSIRRPLQTRMYLVPTQAQI